MKLTVLLDNNTLIDRYLLGEPGVSYLIEDDGKRILFDVGYSDAFIKNAQKLAVNLLDIDFVLLSHSHLDHTWGLAPLVRLYTEARIEGLNLKLPRLITHPSTFLSRTVDNLPEIGSLLTDVKLSRHFQLEPSRRPVWLTDRLVFLGEIERKNDFEARNPLGRIVEDGEERDDFVPEDSALAYKSPRGLVIITGCSHAGICNIVDYAKKVCAEQKIADIIGGFHLLNPSAEQLQGTIAYMRALHPDAVHACHCTDLNSKIALAKVVNLQEVGSGLKLEY
jgi:7,8-dihydropterin-6-yl-methyl-4-(beta-D-ribofuranosyl)aminobenzene 5'-phosphate synthase